jgi:hypothetical protein
VIISLQLEARCGHADLVAGRGEVLTTRWTFKPQLHKMRERHLGRIICDPAIKNDSLPLQGQEILSVVLSVPLTK